MNNFTYYNPTKLVFGKDTIPQLAELIDPKERILITYGGGSIKANGVYDQVKTALAGRTLLEFGGIQPNPLYETLMNAVALCRTEKISFLLAVGGGSVLDGTKFIAAAARYRKGRDPWNILAKHAKVLSAIPLASVLTLPATGSESNTFAVISRQSTQEKLAFGTPHCYPQFAILDPATTISLPAKQTRNGIVDAFVHVMEQYCTFPASAPLQDRYAESILQTLVEFGPALMKDPANYDLRATIMYAATQALNGLIGCGVPQDWATHMIGHEVTAFYGLDHAETLALILPALLRHEKDRKSAKLVQLGRRVFNITTPDAPDAIAQTITAIENFFHALEMPTQLAAYQIAAPEAAEKIRTRFSQRNTILGESQAIKPENAAEILLAA